MYCVKNNPYISIYLYCDDLTVVESFPSQQSIRFFPCYCTWLPRWQQKHEWCVKRKKKIV